MVGKGACARSIQKDESERPRLEGEKLEVLGTLSRG